jgi:hypothetical protein
LHGCACGLSRVVMKTRSDSWLESNVSGAEVELRLRRARRRLGPGLRRCLIAVEAEVVIASRFCRRGDATKSAAGFPGMKRSRSPSGNISLHGI